MKVIILAAGEGSRLRPYTNEMPKCLVPLGGKSVLDWQLDTMRSCGIDDITIVKGYMADCIEREGLNSFVNKDYATTNMVMTLWCAEEKMEGEVIVAYGDIVYDNEVLQALIDAPHDISVVVDVDWEKYWNKRFSDPLADAEAFSMDENNKIKLIGQKADKLSDVEAGYIGLIKLKGKGVAVFKQSFLRAQGANDAWGSPRPFQNAYMTDMLQGLVNEGHDLYAVKIKRRWLEIDSVSDLQLADKCFKVDGNTFTITE
jgi:choline kinase